MQKGFVEAGGLFVSYAIVQVVCFPQSSKGKNLGKGVCFQWGGRRDAPKVCHLVLGAGTFFCLLWRKAARGVEPKDDALGRSKAFSI